MKRNSYKVKSKKNYLSWVIIGLFISVTIFFTIITATSGAQWKELESAKEKLLSENRNLESELVSLSSLKSVETKASELGFIKPQKVIYITDVFEVAKAK